MDNETSLISSIRREIRVCLKWANDGPANGVKIQTSIADVRARLNCLNYCQSVYFHQTTWIHINMRERKKKRKRNIRT